MNDYALAASWVSYEEKDGCLTTHQKVEALDL